MTAIVIPRDAKRPLEVGKFARNDRPPTAAFQKQLAELAGYCAYVRSRTLARSRGTMSPPNSATLGVDRVRGRFAFHAGPFSSTLMVRFIMAQQNNGTATAPYATLRVATSDGTVVGECRAQYGAAFIAVDLPVSWGERTTQLTDPVTGDIVALDPDTDYYVTLTEHNYGRIQSFVVKEVSMLPNTNNGYAGPVSSGGPIFDVDRATTMTMARSLNQRGSAHLWNWWAETDSLALTIASSTFTNVIDGTSTASASPFLPGATLDLRNRARHKDASMVPVVMKVYASGTTATGKVRLLDSDGLTVLEVTDIDAAGWYAAAGMLPATIAKYDLYAAATSGSVTIKAVSIYRLAGAASEALAEGPAHMRSYAYDGTASMS